MTLEDYFKKALGEMQFHLIGKSFEIEQLQARIKELEAQIPKDKETQSEGLKAVK